MFCSLSLAVTWLIYQTLQIWFQQSLPDDIIAPNINIIFLTALEIMGLAFWSHGWLVMFMVIVFAKLLTNKIEISFNFANRIILCHLRPGESSLCPLLDVRSVSNQADVASSHDLSQDTTEAEVWAAVGGHSARARTLVRQDTKNAAVGAVLLNCCSRLSCNGEL